MWKRQEQLYMFMNAIVHTFRMSTDPGISPYKNYDIVFSGDFNMNLIQRFPTTTPPIQATFLQCSDVPGQETIIYTNGENAPSSFGGKNKGEYNPTNIDFAVYYPKVTMAAAPPAVKSKVTPILPKPGSKSPVKTGSADKPFKPDDYGYNAGTLYQVYSISGTNVRLVALQSSVAYARTDAIVNAANEECLMGGGVDGSITEAGGDLLAKKRKALSEIITGIRCPTGKATLTTVTDTERKSDTSYKLKTNNVIHAVGPNYNNYKSTFTEADNLLKSAYTSTIQLADNLKIGSIAFCFICGDLFAGGRDRTDIKKIGIDAIIKETTKLKTSIKLHTIIVCAFKAVEEYDPLLKIMADLVTRGTLTKGEPVKSSPLPPTKPTSTYTPTCTHPFCIANPGIEAVHAIIVVRRDPPGSDCIILGKAKGVANLTDNNSKDGKYDLIGGKTDGKCIFQTLQEESIEESRLVSIDESYSKKINIFFKKGTSEFHVKPWRNVTKNVTENKLIFVGEIDLRKTSTGGANEYYYRDATNIPQGVDKNWDGDVAVLTNTIQDISKSPEATGAYKDNTEITCQNPNKLTEPTYSYAAKHIREFKNTPYYKDLNFT